MNKLITVFSNYDELSRRTRDELEVILAKKGYAFTYDYSADSDLIICIGGDGAFLEAVHKCDFPSSPAVGINTGHLGFFQELTPNQMEQFIEDFEKGNYSIQELGTVKCEVATGYGLIAEHFGLNEIVVRGTHSSAVHMDISIGSHFIESFGGDGILVSTSAGSTAYNYSLGGSIMDPRLNALQVTPIAPINTTAFRTFTSSIMIPSELSIELKPSDSDSRIIITNDGIQTEYSYVELIKITASDKKVKLLRFKDYNFWDKVKSKFL